ncbi:cytochrome c [Polymorphobacter megasporae]|uniref:cytochrome c n=1 Tax=Glacieibacterium megasporae TaxID=2835787 RepID=UPI001C1E8A3F|nr:cytochrome c [Polymorphobacter megasporae]UAJ08741.1 c-type cytochrome [Polymorphobacter megasporae]
MLRRVIIGVAVVGLLVVIGLAALSWRPAIAAIDRPAAASFPATQVAQGAVLASAGYCSACHTAKGGKAFAGGYPMATGFGTVYSTNITPDVATGIGGWSEPAFRRAMHEGVSRDGAHLFPAFPYDHFTKLTDTDVAALYAYFMTREPVRQEARDNTIPFPLSLRPLQAGWKLLFFTPSRYVPQPPHGAAWNRGAYLVEGISHCGACHTPRNALGAEKHDRMYAGAPVDHWIAPPLDATNPAPLAWSHDELVAYLGTGISRFHGTAAGPMAEVPRGLAALPPEDVAAIATYLVSLNGSAARAAEGPAVVQKALAADRIGVGLQYDPAARLYAGACASCHYNGRGQVNPLRPDLALNTAVTMDDPTNLIRVILYGIDAKDGAPGVVMPGFARGFTDADIARLAAYLRATRTTKAAWPSLQNTVASIRAQGQGQ